MQKEILEQPTVIGDTLQSFLHPLNRTVELPDLAIDLAAIPRITISACGPAYFAGLAAKYSFEQVARQPVEVDIASEFRYRAASPEEHTSELQPLMRHSYAHFRLTKQNTPTPHP